MARSKTGPGFLQVGECGIVVAYWFPTSLPDYARGADPTSGPELIAPHSMMAWLASSEVDGVYSSAVALTGEFHSYQWVKVDGTFVVGLSLHPTSMRHSNR